MISVKYTLLLLSLAFTSVPEAWAAPVGTRSVNVKAMRRMEMEREHMRRSHHSAVEGSFVVRDPAPVTPDPSTPVVAREPAPVVARADDSTVVERTVTQPFPVSGKMMRRHHLKNEGRGSLPPPRPLPRFKRDENAKREHTPELVERKTDATDANVARNLTNPAPRDVPAAAGGKPTADTKRELQPTGHVNNEKREPAPLPTSETSPDAKKEKREPASVHSETATPAPTPDSKNEKRAPEPTPAPEPIRPIRMFRRAMAFEDLD
ncbi:hypothetical protein H0H87_002355 [Tephrocybe sp. NHM501043]|nr:hypothetical protein H0H87_002355 [Tephrocybe sp. NHM501043]